MIEMRAQLEIVRAIVVDANCMSRGRLSLAVIDEIVGTIQDYELGAELWIAEPVLWEWVEHAYSDVKSVIEKVQSVEDSLSDAGLSHKIPTYDDDALDIDLIVRGIEDAIGSYPEVRFLRLLENPASAYGGIRDQVLQVGAGSSKGASGKSVKTGASDGATCRLIEANAGSSLRDVVVVSADADVVRYFRDNADVTIFRSWADLRAVLVDLRPRDEVASERFASLAKQILVGGGAPPSIPRSFDARNEAAREFLDSQFYLETTLSFEAIRSVEEVADVEISDNGDFATATVLATVDVELTGLYWNEVDDTLDQDAEWLYGVPAELSVEARFTDGIWSFSVADGSIAEPDG